MNQQIGRAPTRVICLILRFARNETKMAVSVVRKNVDADPPTADRHQPHKANYLFLVSFRAKWGIRGIM